MSSVGVHACHAGNRTGILPKNVGKDAEVATGGTLWVALWVWSLHGLDANRQNV